MHTVSYTNLQFGPSLTGFCTKYAQFTALPPHLLNGLSAISMADTQWQFCSIGLDGIDTPVLDKARFKWMIVCWLWISFNSWFSREGGGRSIEHTKSSIMPQFSLNLCMVILQKVYRNRLFKIIFFLDRKWFAKFFTKRLSNSCSGFASTKKWINPVPAFCSLRTISWVQRLFQPPCLAAGLSGVWMCDPRCFCIMTWCAGAMIDKIRSLIV